MVFAFLDEIRPRFPDMNHSVKIIVFDCPSYCIVDLDMFSIGRDRRNTDETRILKRKQDLSMGLI
jgi:hypothetical protein